MYVVITTSKGRKWNVNLTIDKYYSNIHYGLENEREREKYNKWHFISVFFICARIKFSQSFYYFFNALLHLLALFLLVSSVVKSGLRC